MFEERVEVRGHIIDSMILPRIMDEIMDIGANFVIEEFEVGRTKTETSRAILRLLAPERNLLDRAVERVQQLGAAVIEDHDAAYELATKEGVFPLEFYSTSNLRTLVRLDGDWVPVDRTEMDCGIRLDLEQRRAECVPINRVRRGDAIVTGHAGIRVEPLQRARGREVFAFMRSAVSSEKPKELVIRGIAEEMREIRDRGGKIVVVGGPAIIHTGAGRYLTRLIEAGYVNCLFAGNALAVHDIEAALYGTSLGTSLQNGASEEGGHQHHLRAINLIRHLGSIRAAVEQGYLTSGIMHACVQRNLDLVLAGSIRDDGPLPEVMTDVIEAQEAMREHLAGADLVLLIASMLHSIAVGNLLPASVHTVVVDISPAVVTKLSDRGTSQTLSLVTDVESFLRELSIHLA